MATRRSAHCKRGGRLYACSSLLRTCLSLRSRWFGQSILIFTYPFITNPELRMCLVTPYTYPEPGFQSLGMQRFASAVVRFLRTQADLLILGLNGRRNSSGPYSIQRALMFPFPSTVSLRAGAMSALLCLYRVPSIAHLGQLQDISKSATLHDVSKFVSRTYDEPAAPSAPCSGCLQPRLHALSRATVPAIGQAACYPVVLFVPPLYTISHLR